MFDRGDAPADIAVILQVSPQTVRAWRREYDAGGLRALAARPHPGPKPKLDAGQKQQLLALLADSPDAHGLTGQLWTTSLIARLIRDRFAVSYHPDHVGVMLRQLGYSYQKPALRPRERDPEKIQRWKDQTFPEIVKRSRDRNATIVFVDEAGYRMTPSVKKQWAPRGQTPVLEHRCRHHNRVSVIGGLAVRPGGDPAPAVYLNWHPAQSVTAEKVAGFLCKLIKQIDGPITLIWDNLQAHRSKLVKRVVDNHRQLEINFLPPYAPDLNPIEGLWCVSKYHRLANYCPQELDELAATAAKTTEQVAQRPDLLHACIRQTGLHHALWPRRPQ